MRALVTGAAGFIGSHLAERLAADGWDVVAVDGFTPYYDLAQKRANAAAVGDQAGVAVLHTDLLTADLAELLDGVDVVFHQAGQPGVRASWTEFGSYVEHNLLATERLLAASSAVGRFVFASSSSIYGNAESYPTPETALPNPNSAYGVTKLATEHLCGVYARNFGVHAVSLRYFTVFGPRQRPDMALHRLIRAALDGVRFPLFGSGRQVRDFTYVDDVVEANLRAAAADVAPGTILNVAGGAATTLDEVISLVERLTGRTIDLDRREAAPGDVERTGGSIEAARSLLGWEPAISLEDGLARQIAWHRSRAG